MVTTLTSCLCIPLFNFLYQISHYLNSQSQSPYDKTLSTDIEDMSEMAEMDPEELPALLYQVTAISRKCGGKSARLKSLVLTAISEVEHLYPINTLL